MKISKYAIALFLTGILFTACSDDDNGDTPEPVNEEEVITTLTVSLFPDAGGTPIILRKVDTDGDGPNAPTVDVLGNLMAGATYSGSIELLNETVDPAENITTEVAEESDEHQFFYTSDANLDVATEYKDTDGDGNPLGIEFTLTAGAAGTGTLTVTLRHEPKKPNDGSLADAGGETDADATFTVIVQ